MSKYIITVFTQPWKLWSSQKAPQEKDDNEIPVEKMEPSHSEKLKTFAEYFVTGDESKIHVYLEDPLIRQLVFRRFLSARNWDLQKAKDMLKEALEWRTNYKTDQIAFFPPPKGFLRGYDMDELLKTYDRGLRKDSHLEKLLERLREGYHGTWHKWDREGHPVYIERSGQCDPRQICFAGKAAAKEVNKDGKETGWEQHLLKGHVLFMELGCHLANHQSRRLKKPVYQFTYICDLKGYSWHHIYQPVLNVLKVIIENDKKNYPETTRYALVVNAPGIVSIAWNFIRPILDKRTADKVLIMGGNYEKKLFEIVDPANLPGFLGGTCDCEGECVPITYQTPIIVFKETNPQSPADKKGKGK